MASLRICSLPLSLWRLCCSASCSTGKSGLGGLAACEIVFQILAALATGKLNLGAAFIILFLESFLLSVLLGFAAGLLLSLLLKSMTPLKNG